ncbi:MAG TPA: FkbM family methyltransferase [Syntrophales bacterium]|nr:FkbM family methyltransferase [Syntrophales bacterium]
MNEILEQIAQRIHAAPDKMRVLDWLFGLHKQKALAGTPVVLVGAGSLGKDLCLTLQNQGVLPVCFCDNDSSRNGGSLCGIPIISFDELKKQHRDSLILISTLKYQDLITNQLLQNGFNSDRVLFKAFDSALVLYFMEISQNNLVELRQQHSSKPMFDVLLENEQSVFEAYHLFADQRSKDLFLAILAFMVSNDNLQLFRDFILSFCEPISAFGFDPSGHPEAYFYFNNDVLSVAEDEVYVDVGAFDGDTIETFVQTCNRHQVDYKHIFAFEPDPRNYRALKKNTREYKNVSCHQIGLWSQSQVLRFLSSRNSVLEAGAAINSEGDIDVQVVSLDDFIRKKKVSFIKMDPPGNVIPHAIRGAATTIARDKPKLVLGAYHSLEAYFEIPLLVKSICPDYKLYLRHNSWTLAETDLYAIV